MGGHGAVFLSIVAVGAALLATRCRATQYTVGGASGWKLGTNFDTWLHGKTFQVGDTLDFKYTTMHDVMEVSKADYDGCQGGNALKTHTDGNTTILVKSAGTLFFICGVPGHCAGGMKIAVPVKASGKGAPTASYPAKVPSASATPSTDNNSVSAKNVGLVFGSVLMAVAGSVLF